MVEGHVALICAAVAALALVAAALGIVGEATKSKAMRSTRIRSSFVRFDGASCVYRRTPAFGCGVAAAASLLTGQLVLTAAAGCWDRCRTRSGDRRRAAIVCSSLLSWFLAMMAASAFIVGALRSQSGERRPREGISTYYRCTVLVAGVFAGGSFFAVAAAAVGIGSYVALEEAACSAPPRPPPALALAGEIRQGVVGGASEVSGTTGTDGQCNNLIRTLKFVTNVRTYGPFGNPRSGTAPFSIPVQNNSRNCRIVGFFARGKLYLDAIGVHVQETAAAW
nr:unnamed protein product [Digitaria exilis]